MKRNTSFFIAIASAVLTFGAFTLIFGPKHTHWRSHPSGWHGVHHEGRHGCDQESHDDKS